MNLYIYFFSVIEQLSNNQHINKARFLQSNRFELYQEYTYGLSASSQGAGRNTPQRPTPVHAKLLGLKDADN